MGDPEHSHRYPMGRLGPFAFRCLLVANANDKYHSQGCLHRPLFPLDLGSFRGPRQWLCTRTIDRIGLRRKPENRCLLWISAETPRRRRPPPGGIPPQNKRASSLSRSRPSPDRFGWVTDPSFLSVPGGPAQRGAGVAVNLLPNESATANAIFLIEKRGEAQRFGMTGLVYLNPYFLERLWNPKFIR
jgi:hypothetical protein